MTDGRRLEITYEWAGNYLPTPSKNNKKKEQVHCNDLGWQQFHVTCEATFPVTCPEFTDISFYQKVLCFVPGCRIKRRHACVQERGNEFANYLDAEPLRRGQLLSCSSFLVTLATTCSVTNQE